MEISPLFKRSKIVEFSIFTEEKEGGFSIFTERNETEADFLKGESFLREPNLKQEAHLFREESFGSELNVTFFPENKERPSASSKRS